MLNQRIRSQWDRVMRPIGGVLGRAGVSPDAATALGVVLQAYAGYLILDGRLVAAGLVSIAAALMDVFDGAIAKARGTTSKFGALLDSTTDRLADALVFLPIAWLYGVSPDIPAHDEPWVAATALVAAVASFLVSYVRARAEGLGFECSVGIAERAERMILMILALLFGFVPLAVVLVAAASTITLGQRLVHVRRQAARA